MTGVVSTTAARAHTPSKSPTTGGDITDASNAGGDRFRQLLSKLTAGGGGNEKSGAAVPGAVEPEQGRPAVPTRVLEPGFAHAGRSVPDGGADAAAQLPGREDIRQAQGAATQVLELLNESMAANARSSTTEDNRNGEKGDTLPNALADILRLEDAAAAPPVAADQTAGASVANQSAVAGIQAAVSSAASEGMKADTDSTAATGQVLGTPSITAKPAQGAAPAPQHGEAGALGQGTTRALADAASVSGNAAAQREDTATAGKTEITVLRQETHFAPIPQPSPMLQIAGHIKSELDQRPGLVPALVPPGLTYAQPSSDPVLKILHIRLEPEELGTVTVRMSLKDDTLQLQVNVEKQTAAHVLQKDHEVLSTALRSAGYLIDGITVQVAASEKTQIVTNPQGAPSFQASAQSASGEPQTQGGSGHGQGSARDQGAGRSFAHDRGQGAPGRADGTGSLYL